MLRSSPRIRFLCNGPAMSVLLLVSAALAVEESKAQSSQVDKGAYFDFQVGKSAQVQPGSPGPLYPAILRDAGIEGEVLISFVVDVDGRPDVTTFAILRSTHPLFSTSAKNALPTMRFSPAEVDGRKVRQLVQMPFSFGLATANKPPAEREAAQPQTPPSNPVTFPSTQERATSIAPLRPSAAEAGRVAELRVLGAASNHCADAQLIEMQRLLHSGRVNSVREIEADAERAKTKSYFRVLQEHVQQTSKQLDSGDPLRAQCPRLYADLAGVWREQAQRLSDLLTGNTSPVQGIAERRESSPRQGAAAPVNLGGASRENLPNRAVAPTSPSTPPNSGSTGRDDPSAAGATPRLADQSRQRGKILNPRTDDGRTCVKAVISDSPYNDGRVAEFTNICNVRILVRVQHSNGREGLVALARFGSGKANCRSIAPFVAPPCPFRGYSSETDEP